MDTKTLLKKLGLGPKDRAAIVHIDDVGMCQASLQAFAELADYGTVTSGSVMVPCSWFPATAAYCRAHPDVDMGVHATLTSEWSTYRWGPVSTREAASGLMDAEGYFPHTCVEVQRSAVAAAAARELAAQADQAVAAGIDPTHIDTHMGAVTHEKFMGAYIAQALRLRIPAMLPRPEAAGLSIIVEDPAARAKLGAIIPSLEDQGLPLLDGLVAMPLDEPRDQLETAKRLFNSLPSGVSHFILHPSTDTPELRAICPDWESRVWNYRTFLNPALKRFIAESGLVLIGYRALRDAMRG